MRVAVVLLALLTGAPSAGTSLTEAELQQARQAIEAMRTNRRGPYQGVAWYCNDGAILPPEPYACVEHGGGVQHGVLSRDAKRLAKLGLHVGTVLAALELDDLTTSDYERCGALIVEAYLERSMEGWVLQSAKTYRGFRQVEDERAAAGRLLAGLAGSAETLERRRPLLQRLLRSLPYGADGSVADQVRSLAGTIGDADPAGFGALRFKIHAMPEPSDIADVEAYAARQQGALVDQARELVTQMRAYYDPGRRLARMRRVRRWIRDRETRQAIDAFVAVAPTEGPAFVRAGAALIQAADAAVRPRPSEKQGERNLLLLHVMDLVEQLWIGVTADLNQRPLPRAEALELALHLVRSAHHLGWLSPREQRSAAAAIAQMGTGTPRLYLEGYEQLGRVLQWSRSRLVFDLGQALVRYEAVEPRSAGVVDDMLRSSAMLPLAKVLDRLSEDVKRLRGGGHRLVGLPGLGASLLRGENPGVAEGELRVLAVDERPEVLRRDQIVLLRHVPPELPPVAGLVTIGAAGSLSHIAMLARDLGIPHAAVGSEVAAALEAMAGTDVILGVSAGRRVALGRATAFDEVDRNWVRSQGEAAPTTLAIDAERLDLRTARVHRLDEIAESDAGVRVGPKAAELGRLKRLFPDRVSDAAVIPFGAFLRHVDRPGPSGEPSPLSQLRQVYQETRGVPAEVSQERILGALARFRAAIESLPFADGFEAEVRAALAKLGSPGQFGVFVRSDTNVEDLDKFTGAGLNQTIANRVAPDEILAAIREVWASPYSERSYRWRQSVLRNPEHVYPSVILHKTVPSEMSGVMVTADLETGAHGALTVSCAEGVAGVVDGGSPETIVIRADGEVRLLASSRTTTRKEIPPPPRSGVELACATGREPLLGEAEIADLVALAAEVRRQIPPRAGGAPWDIEFGFLAGKAYLMQIRPLNVSRVAATHPFLIDLDRSVLLPTEALDMGKEVPACTR